MVSKTQFSAKGLIVGLGVKFLLLALVLGVIVRIACLLLPVTSTDSLGFFHYLGLFGIGALNDIFVLTVLLIPLWLYVLSVERWKMSSPQGYIFLSVLAVLWIVETFCIKALREFNPGFHIAGSALILFWILSYALRLFIPKLRDTWTRCGMAVLLALYLGILLMNAVSECVFWEEFGVRYNFIAVDYLVYTTEVIGNIKESYPMGLIIPAVLLGVAAVEWALFRKEIKNCTVLAETGWRRTVSPVYLGLVTLSVLGVRGALGWQHTSNVFYNELQASGIYSFFRAFFANELDYEQFYLTNDADVIARDIAENYGVFQTDTPSDILLQSAPEARYNVVVVMMESMSASYMARFGNKQNLTPVLDSLYKGGIAFSRMFAAGNRSVRGLEAVTLSRPPAAGESIIKRKDNGGYPSLSAEFQKRGYDTYFFYGGDSYFDNMESFYTRLNHEIIDSKDFTPDEIQFKTIWGVCDEDIYAKLIKTVNGRTDTARPFYAHILTTSNHRPFTYPDKVSIPPTAKSRKGAVMYSDYALGEFFRMARQQPWFSNTVFVLVADHCASSAGKVELPLRHYHIPCIIYAPKIFDPLQVDKVVSQIDIIPTLISLMGWERTAAIAGMPSIADTVAADVPSVFPAFYGQNIFDSTYHPRAFMATYQDLGYLENDTLTVLSPVRRVRQYVWKAAPRTPFALEECKPNPDGPAFRHAVSLYQHSSRRP